MPIHLQTEIIEVHVQAFTKTIKECNLQEFYKNLDCHKYKNLIKVALETFLL